MRSPFGIRSGLSRWHELLGTTAAWVRFIPSGSDSLITSDGNTFQVIGVALRLDTTTATFDGTNNTFDEAA